MIFDKKISRILVIEDNPGDLAIVKDLLAEQISNLVIVHANNFGQAHALLTTEGNVFDVILLDLTLPDKSGQGLVSEMLDISFSCPIIILTGYSDIDFSIMSISKGISDYLIKDELSSPNLYKSITYSIERKKNISNLEESEKRYSDLFHFSPQPMWVCESGNLHFLDVNNAAIKDYGYSREEFLQMVFIEIISSKEIHEIQPNNQSLGEPDQHYFGGIWVHRKKNNASMNVSIHSNQIMFKGKKAILILADDITERIQYISAIEKQNERLQEIAWIQSHIVRAPLARMMGIVMLISQLKMVSPEGLTLLDRFMESSTELDGIIKDISIKTEQININNKSDGLQSSDSGR